MAQFDAKRVSPLEWAGMGAGVVAFLASFFPWFSVSVAGYSASVGAWQTGIGAWLPVLMLLAAAIMIFLPHVGTQVQRLPLIWLILSAASVVIILLRWLTLPDDGGLGLLAAGTGLEAGAGFGLILGLIAAIVSTVAAGLAFRSAPTTATA